MKLGERYFDQDGKLIVQETHDPNPNLARAALAREADEAGRRFSTEMRPVASFPPWLVHQRCAERGVRLDDHDGVAQVLAEMIADRDLRSFHITGA